MTYIEILKFYAFFVLGELNHRAQLDFAKEFIELGICALAPAAPGLGSVNAGLKLHRRAGVKVHHG